MKTVLLLLGFSSLVISENDVADQYRFRSRCDSLALGFKNDPDLQKECDSYYQKKLAQIPRAKIKKIKKAKPFADSIKMEIDYLIKSYKWEDPGVAINFLMDDIFPFPSFTGTVWDDSVITAYVKGSKGCQKIKLRKDNGYSGYIISSCDTVDDTIHIESYRFHFKQELNFTQATSVTLNIKGDTISRGGHDVAEYRGMLSHISKEYIEFSGEPVSLKAQCNRTDTIEVQCKRYKNESCLICKGIDIVSAGPNSLYGYISKGEKITLTKNCKGNPCETTQVPLALYLLNSILKGHTFLVKSSERGTRIYSDCEECEKDKGEYLFPGVE
jgi:hypothetical protein